MVRKHCTWCHKHLDPETKEDCCSEECYTKQSEYESEYWEQVMNEIILEEETSPEGIESEQRMKDEGADIDKY